MTKAILVIDMPKSCEDCPCFCERIRFDGNEWHNGCNVLKLDVTDFDFYETCPLKPMPKRQPESARRFDIEIYNTGYNDCIDELEGSE